MAFCVYLRSARNQFMESKMLIQVIRGPTEGKFRMRSWEGNWYFSVPASEHQKTPLEHLTTMNTHNTHSTHVSRHYTRLMPPIYTH
jgi:hypothetical protein